MLDPQNYHWPNDKPSAGDVYLDGGRPVHVDIDTFLSLRKGDTLTLTLDNDVFVGTVISYRYNNSKLVYEDLKDKTLNIPKEFTGKLGLALTSNTPITVFEDYKDDFDFILFMATIPGESGGKFDKSNFRRIRDFKKVYPNKKVHVDGGVNGEVSFILRNMGVYASVSGSYLFNASTIGTALLNLKLNEIESHFMVKDFMLDLTETPTLHESDLNLTVVLNSMKEGKMGFTTIIGDNNEFKGIIGNADLRQGLLDHIDDLNTINLKDIINTKPLVIDENYTVYQLLRFIKKQSKPILYLPVVNNKNQAQGTVNFINLIKGEL